MRNPEQGGRWGIFGGAFDPVHFGHLGLAREISEKLEYDGILFVPSHNPPRKRGGCVASYEDRLEMLRLATDGRANFEISQIERESPEPGYTLLTVRALKKRFPKAIFDFIIGADLVAELESWYEAEEIVKEVRIVAGSRPGVVMKIPDKFPIGSVRIVQTSLIDLASHQIRERIEAGILIEDLAKLVPPSVAEYIFERGLYQ